MDEEKNGAALLVKTLRKALGMTQEEIGTVIGVSRQMVNYYELNRAGMSAKVIRRYCGLMKLIGEYGREVEILMSCKDTDKVEGIIRHYTEDIIRYLEGRK